MNLNQRRRLDTCLGGKNLEIRHKKESNGDLININYVFNDRRR